MVSVGTGGALGNGNYENWGESGMADNSQQTDTSTDVDTDEKSQFNGTRRGAVVVDSMEQSGGRTGEQKGIYVTSGGYSGDHSDSAYGNGALAFDMDYARWLDDHQRLINDLRSAVNSQVGDNELRLLVGVMAHYDEVFRLKDIGTKSDVFHMFSGNEGTFREMLRVKRSVSASYSQTHFILPEYLMQKDQMQTLDDAKDVLKKAGVADDEMAALERQLMPIANDTAKDTKCMLGFVSAGVESTSAGAQKGMTKEDIELPEESDSEDDEKVEIAQKDVPTAVFEGLVRKREGTDDLDGCDDAAEEGLVGALARIKRSRGA